MKLTLVDISLRNFKGVRDIKINFNDVTNISGENGTGKTSIFDAFTWLLFGKDSSDRKDFNIKTLDAFNQPIHELEHEVSATIDVDGRPYKLRRLYKENWVKKRGELEREMKGHETTYFFNEVPVSQSEFNSKVDVMIPETLVKLITNPLYFNQMKWDARRKVLAEMAGTITDAQVAGSKKEFAELLADLTGKSFEEFKREIASKRKNINDELKLIPTRINEAQRSLPEVADWARLEKDIADAQGIVKQCDEKIENKSLAFQGEYQKITTAQSEKHKLESQLKSLEYENTGKKTQQLNEVDSKISSAESRIRVAKQEIANTKTSVSNNNNRINALEKDNLGLKDRWKKKNEETLVIDPEKLKCPTCQRELEESNKDQITQNLTTNFNTAKQKELKYLDDAGKANKTQMDSLRAANTQSETAIAELEKKIKTDEEGIEFLKKDRARIESEPVPTTPEIEELKQKIAVFHIPAAPTLNTEDYKITKAGAQQIIDDRKAKLSNREQIERLNTRIEELSNEEARLAQEVADLERKEFLLAGFNKAKIAMIEEATNAKFKIVKFKMFDQQINGGEVECCECMINGVPFSDLNTASRIQAGVDIINALSEHYNIFAPVWIDNRESTNVIPESKSQIINLRVTKDSSIVLG